MAALLLLERLSPLERAVFVLREVFAFPFPEVAAAVGRSEAACRQLATRARRHMDVGRPRFAADKVAQDELAARFFDALRDGDVDALQELLAADVAMVGDGGGKAPAFARSVVGAVKVTRVLGAMFPALAVIDASLERRELNGQPGAILRDRDGRVVGTMTPGAARRPDPDDPLRGQPRQAAAPRPGRRRVGHRPRGAAGPPRAPLNRA